MHESCLDSGALRKVAGGTQNLEILYCRGAAFRHRDDVIEVEARLSPALYAAATVAAPNHLPHALGNQLSTTFRAEFVWRHHDPMPSIPCQLESS